MYTIGPNITKRQKQVIMGTILGGSSIVSPKNGKNCYLSMRDKRAQWLQYKATELSNLASAAPFTLEKTCRWHSKCYPAFQEFRDMFYREGERFLNMEIMDILQDIAFAIWVGDCGSMQEDRLVLNTNIWGKHNDVILRFLEELSFHPVTITEKGGVRIMLSSEGTKDFLKWATPHMPEWLTLRVSGKINDPNRICTSLPESHKIESIS